MNILLYMLYDIPLLNIRVNILMHISACSSESGDCRTTGLAHLKYLSQFLFCNFENFSEQLALCDLVYACCDDRGLQTDSPNNNAVEASGMRLEKTDLGPPEYVFVAW